ncbi:MAG: PQQ-binding-like beta-propeller repeat protein [Rickettsiales bacterium]|nr:PQQ-binding-like beta-propeller repeat protein [Rickettsiales bacterium]
MMRGILLTLSCTMLLALSSCNYLPDWIGDQEDEKILPGERIALKRRAELFEAELPAAEGNIQLPPERRNASWNQPLGSSAGVSDHLTLAQPLQVAASTSVGEGTSFSTLIIPAPVIENGRVFALDGNGALSAHDSTSLELIWQSDALVSEDSDDSLLGGGLAVAGKVLYAANDEGKIIALSTEDGRLFWQQELNLPLRAAPRLIGKILLILSADNQLLALNRRDGEPRWIHQGLNDQASQLQSTVPAAGGEMVLATYSSGEVTALSLKDGSELWSDMLAGSAQTALQDERFGALSTLMTPRVSFAGSAKSFTAYMTGNGRRIWERRVPLAAQPWLTGTTLYMLTTDYQLMAVNGGNGKILWVQTLDKKDGGSTILWQHPIVASDTVWMVGSHGQLKAFNALTGEEGNALEIPEGVVAAPVIADGALYLMDKGATLHALR